MKEFPKRTISATIFAATTMISIYCGKLTFLLLHFVLGVITILEFGNMIRHQLIDKIFHCLLFLVMILLLYFNAIDPWIIDSFLLLSLIFQAFLIIKLFQKKAYSNSFWFKHLSSIFYVQSGFFFLMAIPLIKENSFNRLDIFVILFLLWMNDLFAYAVGKKIGKTKLFPSVSPKKTVEGFAGGLLFTSVIGILFTAFSAEPQILKWVIICILISCLGTVGDLIQSKFKRQASIKDSGNIMPGHGGLFDRLDATIFVMPVLFLLLKNFSL